MLSQIPTFLKNLNWSPYEYNFQVQFLKAYCSDIGSAFPMNQKLSLLFISSCYQTLGVVGTLVEDPMSQLEGLYPNDPLVLAMKSVVLDRI